jgi:hypothetical protein
VVSRTRQFRGGGRIRLRNFPCFEILWVTKALCCAEWSMTSVIFREKLSFFAKLPLTADSVPQRRCRKCPMSQSIFSSKLSAGAKEFTRGDDRSPSGTQRPGPSSETSLYHAVHPVQIVRRCSRQCAEVVLNVKKDLCTRHTR